MQRVYFEEFCRRVTEDAPYAVFHRENVNYVAHIHEEIEVGFVVSGSVRASGESCDYLLNEGDIYVFLPDEIHALTSESPNLLYILRLLPKQSDRVDFSSFRSSSNCVRAGDAAHEPLRRAVLEMVDEHDRAREGRDMVLRKCRYEIFLAIYRLMDRIPLSEEDRQRRAGRTSLLRRVNDYIADHYAEPVSLDDLANFEPKENMGLSVPPKGKHIFGVVTVGDKGQIVIPAKARKTFDIVPGDQLVVLGDEAQGLAIIKTESFLSIAEEVKKLQATSHPRQQATPEV